VAEHRRAVREAREVLALHDLAHREAGVGELFFDALARAAVLFLPRDRVRMFGRGRAKEVVKLGEMAGEVRGQHDARARFRDAETFAKNGGGFVEVVDAEVRGDEVERLVVERHLGGVADVQFDIVQAVDIQLPLRAGDGLGPRVDADEIRRRPVHVGELEERKAGRAADVEAGDVRPQFEVVEEQRAEPRAPERRLVVCAFREIRMQAGIFPAVCESRLWD
jgi:hypothetical protein